MSYRKSPDNSFSYSLVGVEGFELSKQIISNCAQLIIRKQSVI